MFFFLIILKESNRERQFSVSTHEVILGVFALSKRSETKLVCDHVSVCVGGWVCSGWVTLPSICPFLPLRCVMHRPRPWKKKENERGYPSSRSLTFAFRGIDNNARWCQSHDRYLSWKRRRWPRWQCFFIFFHRKLILEKYRLFYNVRQQCSLVQFKRGMITCKRYR